MKENLKSKIKDINNLWKEHFDAKFPDEFYEIDTNGIDLVTLDADIAGCVSTFVENENLNLYQTAILGLCLQEINSARQIVSVKNAEYIERLELLAQLVLKVVARKNRTEHFKNQ